MALHALGLTTTERMAVACIASATAVAPLAYAIGRSLLDERRARMAGPLAAASPCLLPFDVTSADAVYAAAGALSAALLIARGRY